MHKHLRLPFTEARLIIMTTLLTVMGTTLLFAKETAARPTTSTAEKITTAALLGKRIPGVEFRSDVSYLPADRSEKLDVYLPSPRSTSAPSPAIVIIHGGGWVGGKKDAVRWVRVHADELQIDPNRIGVMGGSAGGHLALMVAYTGDSPELQPAGPYPGVSDKVSACVNLYGITNLLTRQEADKSGKLNGKLRTSTPLFSETREEAPVKWKLASPVTHITTATPPTLIIHGTADTTVDRDQSHELATRLKQAGVEHQLLMIPDARHAFILGDPRLKVDLRPVVLKFFDQHLSSTGDQSPANNKTTQYPAHSR